MSDNFSFLFYYLKKEKINIDQKEFQFQFKSHPDYPLLLAISDTLSFFKINNLATAIEKEAVQYLPNNFNCCVFINWVFKIVYSGNLSLIASEN